MDKMTDFESFIKEGEKIKEIKNLFKTVFQKVNQDMWITHVKNITSLINEKNIDYKEDDEGNTLLLMAISKLNPVPCESDCEDDEISNNEKLEKIIDILLEKGANVDIQNNEGDTALIEASYYEHANIVDNLLEKGANVDIRNKQGDTALIIAVKKVMLKFLIKY